MRERNDRNAGRRYWLDEEIKLVMVIQGSIEEWMIDLTVMNSNMVYSTVYQMMADAPSYVGKLYV